MILKSDHRDLWRYQDLRDLTNWSDVADELPALAADYGRLWLWQGMFVAAIATLEDDSTEHLYTTYVAAMRRDSLVTRLISCFEGCDDPRREALITTIWALGDDVSDGHPIRQNSPYLVDANVAKADILRRTRRGGDLLFGSFEDRR